MGFSRRLQRKKLYKKSLIGFYDKQQHFEERFKSALTSGDLKLATNEAHTLKGLSATLGMMSLHEQAKSLESACKENSDNIETTLNPLLKELNKVLDGLICLKDPNISNTKITWSDDYSVGDKKIDQQHKKIISFINTLVEHSEERISSEIIVDTLDELMKYASEHLEYEEKRLTELKYPELNEHIKHHQHYLETITEFNISASNNDTKSLNKLIRFLTQWWSEHILHEDMKYKPLVQSNIEY